jgi:hypothetical protein
MDLISGKEWGLLLLDEVHVVPARMFRQASDMLFEYNYHCLLICITRVRESSACGWKMCLHACSGRQVVIMTLELLLFMHELDIASVCTLLLGEVHVVPACMFRQASDMAWNANSGCFYAHSWHGQCWHACEDAHVRLVS